MCLRQDLDEGLPFFSARFTLFKLVNGKQKVVQNHTFIIVIVIVLLRYKHLISLNIY